MNLDELTIGQAKELARAFGSGGGATHSFEVGKCYLIRTVAYYYTGRLVNVTDSDLVLAEAAWIADTGRFANALATGELIEVEPYPDRVIVNRATVVDASPWNHPLPRKVK